MSKTISTAFLLLAVILTGVTASAQTQQGYVKTKGRMVNGQLVPGQGLKGATVSVKGRTVVLVNADDGAFSFPVTEQQFRMDSVNKKGYQLVDMDACPRTYNYSNNPIYIVMETPDQQLQDKLTAERKIRRNLQKQLQEREDEIEALKEQQKISDEEYRQALQKLYADQESNEQLISDMAKRYSELDYDQLDEFYRQVSYCIENGNLVKADSLLSTKGDVTQQVEAQLRKGQAIQEQETQLNQAKAVHAADQEELARRCYSYFETFAAQHLNDTAAYYLELRASLDTTNVEWLKDAGSFIVDYIADYDKALRYFQLGLRQAQLQFGEKDAKTANLYDGIGKVAYYQFDYETALENFNKAININQSIFGENHPALAMPYTRLGIAYMGKEDYDKAMECINKSLALLSDDHPDLASCYIYLGILYAIKNDCSKALEYYNKALSIKESISEKETIDVATIYFNMGATYERIGNPEKAQENYKAALAINKKILGKNHPEIAINYQSIGWTYFDLQDYEKSMENFYSALSIMETIAEENHPYVGSICSGLGNNYIQQDDYDKALYYFSKSFEIRKHNRGEVPYIAETAEAIGDMFYEKSQFSTALEFYQKCLEVQTSIYGENSPETMKTKEKIAEIQAKLNEQKE
jgi:tetratricopeptide (TPR) repeat protein